MSAQDLEQRGMSLAVALDFADNPRPYHSMACPADTNGELYRALKTLAAALRQQPEAARYPSYDALLLIVQSVAGALERAGLTDCDDPGEAIDVIRERLERRIAELETAAHQPAPVVDDAMVELIEAAKRVCAAWNSGNPPELKRIGEREYHSPAGSMLDATEIAPLYAALARAQGVQS